MSKITINGKSYQGNNVIIKDGVIVVDGDVVDNDSSSSQIVIHGDVSVLHTDKSVSCHNINGDVVVSGNITCDDIDGNVTAGGSVSCDGIDGDVKAGGSVSCNEIDGDVFAGGSVSCNDISGSVICNDISGSINAKNCRK
jgi:hypothetical protein